MSNRKKARNGAGAFERRPDRVCWIRPLMPPGHVPRRPRIPIPGSENMTDAEARRAGAKLAREAREGKLVVEARSGAIVQAKPTGPAGDWRTVRQLGAAWTGSAKETDKTTPPPMFARFGKVAKLKIKAGAYIDRVSLEAYAYDVKTRGEGGPAFGDLDVAAVTSDDIAKVMGALPADHRAETRIKQYNRLHRLFELAEFPCRLRPEGTNPVKKYLRPEMDADKLYSFLFPGEALLLLRGRRRVLANVVQEDGTIADVEAPAPIPLARRVLYALALFTGQRKGSLFALRWKHVDFDHGTLASFRTKTGAAQYFVADRGLMAVLQAWKAHQGSPGDEQPIVSDAEAVLGCEPRRLAPTLRDDLKAVGVTRAILFEAEQDNVQELRFHDARATFCTWARRAGKSDSWISERTGQKETGKMIDRYDRGAQTLADLQYEPFPDISRAIPELLPTRLPTPAMLPAASLPETAAILAASSVGAIGFEPTTPTVSSGNGQSEGPQKPESDSQVSDTSSAEATSQSPRSPRDDVGNALGNAIDPVEAALAKAIEGATAAGEWATVAKLAGELEVRRLARAGVPSLSDRRRARK